jgi:hypothetical protein
MSKLGQIEFVGFITVVGMGAEIYCHGAGPLLLLGRFGVTGVVGCAFVESEWLLAKILSRQRRALIVGGRRFDRWVRKKGHQGVFRG